jgi:hypothetical protein
VPCIEFFLALHQCESNFSLLQALKSPGSGDVRSEAETVASALEYPSAASTFTEISRPATFQDDLSPPEGSESDSAPHLSNPRRDITKSSLNSLLHLIVTILRNSGGELKATDGANCLKSILQSDMPSAIKDISDAGGLTRFCEIHSAYLEFISDGCGSGNIRLKGKGKAGSGLLPQLWPAGSTNLYSGENSSFRLGHALSSANQSFGSEPLSSKSLRVHGGLYGDWNSSLAGDQVQISPVSQQNGNESVPKIWSLWGHGTPASIQSLKAGQEKGEIESSLNSPSSVISIGRCVHSSFPIIIKDESSDGSGSTSTSRAGPLKSGGPSVIISNDICHEENGVDIAADGLLSPSFGAAVHAHPTGTQSQTSLPIAGGHFSPSANQTQALSPKQPRRLEAFAQIAERQAFEAFSSSSLSYSASSFHPGPGAVSILEDVHDLDLENPAFRFGEGLHHASTRGPGNHDGIAPLASSPGVSMVAYDNTSRVLCPDIMLPFSAISESSGHHNLKASFLLSEFEHHPSGVFGGAASRSHFINLAQQQTKSHDPIGGAVGSRLQVQQDSAHEYLAENGGGLAGGGFLSEEMNGYFGGISLGPQRKVLQPGSDLFLNDQGQHALDGLSPWSSLDNVFSATYLDKAGSPQNIDEVSNIRFKMGRNSRSVA